MKEPMYNKSVTEQIKDRIDLVDFIGRYVQLSRNGKGYKGLCPFHDDKNPSLTVDPENKRWHCFGCGAGGDVFNFLQKIEHIDFQEALRRLSEETGIKIDTASRKAVVSTETGSTTQESQRVGLSLDDYAKAKAIPIEFLKELELSDAKYRKVQAVRMPYLGADGEVLSVRFRLAMTGTNRFRWRSKDKAVLYGLWRLQLALKKGYVVLLEGESDCHTLWYNDIPALGIPGASVWREEWSKYLEGIPTIYLVVEPDEGGQSILKWLERSEIRDRVRLVDLGEAKDPSGLYLSCPEDFLQRWGEALESSRLWTETTAKQRKEEASKAYTSAQELLHDPGLLERIRAIMEERGYAGDPTPPLLVYLAMTSRLTKQPINIALVAPSASGKNRAIDAALELIPADEVYIEKAGSPRALIYSGGDYQHRVIVVGEADSIPDEGPAAAAIRSIAEDNVMLYDVVEKNQMTGKQETRQIKKQGPTCLITTSTKSVSHQLGTRMLEVPVKDDEKQTRAVLISQAKSFLHTTRNKETGLEQLIALQQWLKLAGERRVVIPFAPVLAEIVPAKIVRMRRDFHQLMELIETIALLYQCQREKTPDGEVIGSIEDYKVARNLVAHIFEVITSEGLTEVVRKTVEAISPSEETSETELAKKLNLSKSGAHYRVQKAIKGGWLINVENRKGYPARLKRGDPLPEEAKALPTLQHQFERYLKDDTKSLEQGKNQLQSEKASRVFDRSAGLRSGVDTLPDSNIKEKKPYEQMKLFEGCGRRMPAADPDKTGCSPECVNEEIFAFQVGNEKTVV